MRLCCNLCWHFMYGSIEWSLTCHERNPGTKHCRVNVSDLKNVVCVCVCASSFNTVPQYDKCLKNFICKSAAWIRLSKFVLMTKTSPCCRHMSKWWSYTIGVTKWISAFFFLRHRKAFTGSVANLVTLSLDLLTLHAPKWLSLKKAPRDKSRDFFP